MKTKKKAKKVKLPKKGAVSKLRKKHYKRNKKVLEKINLSNLITQNADSVVLEKISLSNLNSVVFDQETVDILKKQLDLQFIPSVGSTLKVQVEAAPPDTGTVNNSPTSLVGDITSSSGDEDSHIINNPTYDEVESEKVQNDMTRNNIMATIVVFALIGIMLYLGK